MALRRLAGSSLWRVGSSRAFLFTSVAAGESPRSSEFQRWENGGGTFHNSACIDPTVVIEFGAVVHPRAVLGANVHIGSGAVVGPSVTIGQSTKIGYSRFICFKFQSFPTSFMKFILFKFFWIRYYFS